MTIVTRADGQAELLRENLRQMALVTARLEGRDLGSAVAEIQNDARRRCKLPVGYTYEIGGQYAVAAAGVPRAAARLRASRRRSCSSILVIQFRAFTPAVLILLAAPLSLGGAFAAAARSPAPI